MKERTEQELVALEMLNALSDWSGNIVDIQDLYLSDISKMEDLQCKIRNAFNLCAQGGVDSEGDIICFSWKDFVFEDDPRALNNIKKEKDEEG